MAHHYEATTNGIDSEGAPIASGPFHMPSGRYVGFMIGPGSDHDQVLVEAGPTVLVTVGMVVPIAPFDGAPRVRPLTPFIGAARVHVIGLTDACELAIASPRRARAHWGRTKASGAGIDTLIVPFGGRRHAAVRVALTVAGDIEINGRGYAQSGHFAHELVSVSGSSGDIWHIGGTDHEELFDELEITTTTASGQRWVDVWAAGELGG